jgi:hypothetical protein
VKLFKKSEALHIFKRNGGFDQYSEAFSTILRLFKDIFREVEAFIKITRLFEGIAIKMEAFLIYLRFY